MKLLDLFCKAGGCTRGYQQAGFYVVGVDIESQPRYVGDDFILGDALEVLRVLIAGGYITGQSGRKYYLRDFDLIAASPPCQAYSTTKSLHKKNHPELIEPTRELLKLSGKPYVIENVEGAPLINPLMLCGTMFPDLRVYRHRLFECNPWLLAPPHIIHQDSTPKAGRGTSSPKGFISVAGHFSNVEYVKEAMQIDWMTRDELSQAIPPAYCKWIGERMIEALK